MRFPRSFVLYQNVVTFRRERLPVVRWKKQRHLMRGPAVSTRNECVLRSEPKTAEELLSCRPKDRHANTRLFQKANAASCTVSIEHLMMRTFGSRSRICSFLDDSLYANRVMNCHFSSATIACVPSKHIRRILYCSIFEVSFRVLVSLPMRVSTEKHFFLFYGWWHEAS